MGYIRSVALLNRISALAQPSKFPNVSLATVGGNEFDGSATDDITFYLLFFLYFVFTKVELECA